ncbi:response regulator [Sphingobium indicum]|uniref:response regulator n=1 Tax=Sphingobium indicum TaxID=332055 RepID=UPI0012DDA4C1|nr:response regulator [Sphingobium indicum]
MQLPPSRSKQVVLVVDDEDQIRTMLVTHLTCCGFEVIEAGSADHALRVMHGRCDIREVVTDIQMPGSIDGLALAHLLRERDPGLALLISSGGVFPTDGELPEGASFLHKPYRMSRLVAALSALLGG